jgi:hypothetical protein
MDLSGSGIDVKLKERKKENYSFALHLTSIESLRKKLWASKVKGVLILKI